MTQSAIIHSTFVLERDFPKPPQVVFAAFADPAKKRRWFADGDHHVVEDFTMDFRDGGAERFQYRLNEKTPFPGAVIVHEGSYLDITPNERVVVAATMSFGGKRISATLVTCEILPSGAGAKLICTHQGAFFEGADGPQIREMGWRQILDSLAAELNR